MGVRMTGRYLGNKGVELTHGPSGAKVRTAAPVDNNGDGSSFSPTDLCASSLGACMVTIMAIVAERDDIDITGTHFSVEKEMSAAPRRIASATVEIHLPAALDEKQRAALERGALACPVHKSLGEDVESPTTFVYDVSL